MRVIIQRVMKASVSVSEETISEIGKGLCVLVGISRDDTAQDMEYLVKKVLNLRVFDGENDKRWAKSVVDMKYDVLCVSQFTLYSIMKGNKPDFHSAMEPEKSEGLYNDFLQKMRQAYIADKIKDGKFGAHMQVHIQNDGPVTINMESPAFTPAEREKFAKKQQRIAGAKWQKKSAENGAKDMSKTDSDASLSSQSSSQISQERAQINQEPAQSAAGATSDEITEPSSVTEELQGLDVKEKAES